MPTLTATWGAMAASVWNTLASSLRMRAGSTARTLAGSGVLSVIGISPASSPGDRSAMTVSTPLTIFVSSVFPSTSTNSVRASPSWPPYSPGTSRTSSTEWTR